jgi:glutamate dehydrogenase/leucine dehydrogenase
VKHLFNNKKGNKLDVSAWLLPFDTVNEKIWDMGADIFIPGAASKLVTRDQADRLLARVLR